MTAKEIEILGFPHLGNKMRPRAFWVIDREEIIPDYYDIEAIHKIIYERGLSDGVELGRQGKVNEIRELLGFEKTTKYDL